MDPLKDTLVKPVDQSRLFNERHLVGTPIRFWSGSPVVGEAPGEWKAGETSTVARVVGKPASEPGGGFVAVVGVHGQSGWIPLELVAPMAESAPLAGAVTG